MSADLKLVDSPIQRKDRGAFFTPPELSDFLASWAIRDAADCVLEPSCGEAAFLLSAGDRLRSLSTQPPRPTQLQGIDIHGASVANAKRILEEDGYRAKLEEGSFFDLEPKPKFDAVIGNPPFVRYQKFSGEDRASAQRAALAQGVRLGGLANAWAAFVIHAAAFLKPTGRLGLVLPAELLSVNYAGPVRRFLMERFAEVRLVVFEKRVFPGVLEEVVLLLAEGAGRTDHCQLYQPADASELYHIEPSLWAPPSAEGKWITALLPPEIASTYSEVVSKPSFTSLESWGATDLGMVTGKNNYFAISASTAREHKLKQEELLPISPPSSRHLKGLTFSKASWEEMREADARVYLFRPSPEQLSSAAKKYIASGEAAGIHKAYKCRVRSPWWQVPLIKAPDLFLTYMNHETPRLVANKAGVPYLNSIHGVRLNRGLKRLGMDLIPIASLNSVTLLGSEVVGRAYGGGMLKLEPKEADLLPVPSPQALEAAAPQLRALRPQLAKHLRRGDLLSAVKMVDRVFLLGALGMRSAALEKLREGRELMFSRRRARGKNV